jgi:23S rRNA pseudouridine2605 synthase
VSLKGVELNKDTVSSIRLQKLIARYGTASRRKAELLIKEGRVTVDGEQVTVLGTKVAQGSIIEIDGVCINRDVPRVYLMMNKPPGFLCTTKQSDTRPVVYDLVAESYSSYGLFSVGRLDYLSEGLLLLTNDGDFAHAIAHPSGGVVKKYEVTTESTIPYKVIAAWKNGLYINGEQYAIRDFRKLTLKKVLVTLSEGKNREIRRLFESIHVKVAKLKRVAIGSLELGSLPTGKSRELSPEELKRIFQPSR